MLRIARATLNLSRMAAAVERKKECGITTQPRRHVHFVRVRSEMHQRPRLESEQWRARITVGLILPHGVLPALARAWIFQLASSHRQSVDREEKVHRVVLAGVAKHLPGYGQTI